MFALFPEFGARTRPQDLWPFLISETGLKFLIWTQGETQPARSTGWRGPKCTFEAQEGYFVVWNYIYVYLCLDLLKRG